MNSHDDDNIVLSFCTLYPLNPLQHHSPSRPLGTVRAHIYSTYARAIGYCMTFTILATLVLMQLSRNATDWWLSYWVANEANGGKNVTPTALTHSTQLWMENR